MEQQQQNKQQDIRELIPSGDGEWCEKVIHVHATIYRVLVKRNERNNYSLLLHQAIVGGDYRGTPLYIFRGISSDELVLEMIELFSYRRN